MAILSITLSGLLIVHITDPAKIQDTPLIYSIVFITLFILGPGKYSLDALLEKIQKMKTQVLLIILAILAGAVLPLQAGLNVQLGKSVHQPIFAAFASFLIGTIGLLVYLLLVKFDFSSIAQTKTVSPWVWIAGILGAFYVAAVIILAPRLGVALTFVLVVAGQMVVSIIFDHFGLLGLPVKQVNWPRLLGVGFLIAGVLLIRRF